MDGAGLGEMQGNLRFQRRHICSWGHGKLEYTGVTSKPDEISGDILPPPTSRNTWGKTPPLHHHGIGPGISSPREHRHGFASLQSSAEEHLDVVPVLLQAEDPPIPHISLMRRK